MRHLSLFLGLSVALTGSCLAQRTRDARDALTFITQLQNASWAQNADAYAGLFDSNGTWDGPFGQNAMGPLNIKTAVGQFFTEFGPLHTVTKSARALSLDVVMADVYQKTKGRGAPLDLSHIANGSVGPPQDADVRTTLILRRQELGWKILTARVADLHKEVATLTTR